MESALIDYYFLSKFKARIGIVTTKWIKLYLDLIEISKSSWCNRKVQDPVDLFENGSKSIENDEIHW